MSKFKLLSSHRGCEKIFSAIDESITRVQCCPYGGVVRLHMKNGRGEIDIYPTEGSKDKYTIVTWKRDVRTVVFQEIDKNDPNSLKSFLDKGT